MSPTEDEATKTKLARRKATEFHKAAMELEFLGSKCHGTVGQANGHHHGFFKERLASLLLREPQ
jgi:hypothetical protein